MEVTNINFKDSELNFISNLNSCYNIVTSITGPECRNIETR